jgi:hypothetical protein
MYRSTPDTIKTSTSLFGITGTQTAIDRSKNHAGIGLLVIGLPLTTFGIAIVSKNLTQLNRLKKAEIEVEPNKISLILNF